METFIRDSIEEFKTKTNLDFVNCTSLIFGLITVVIISYLFYKTWKYVKDLHYIVDYLPILKKYAYNIPELSEITKELDIIPHQGNIFLLVRLFFPIFMLFGIMVIVLSIASMIKNNSDDISVTDHLIVATIVISFIFIFVILRLLLTFKTPTFLVPYFIPDYVSRLKSLIRFDEFKSSVPLDEIKSSVPEKIKSLTIKEIKSKMTPQQRKKINSQIIKATNKLKSKLKEYKKKAFLLDLDNTCLSKNNDLTEIQDFVSNIFGFNENVSKSIAKKAVKTLEKMINKIPEENPSDILETLILQKGEYIKSFVSMGKMSVNVLIALGIIYIISLINLYSR